MLILNIERLLKLRGIEHPYKFLVGHGFVPQTATNMVKKRAVQIHPAKLERLCRILNCTPNDLFDWQDDGKTALPETHALHSLKRDPTAKSVADLTRDIPADKLEKLGEMIAELNTNSETS
jgi:DNA-binding Xre family transcriptional regulator